MSIRTEDAAETERFWRHFVAEHWERQPLVLAEPEVGLGMDAEEAFALTIAAFDHAVSQCRFFADGKQVLADVRELWPSAADGDWDGFAARMEATLGDADYLLIANHVQAIDFAVFDRARAFLYGLHRAGVGLPSDFADVDIIVGRYASTPHGVHQDPGCSFMAGLKGRKSMVTWPGADQRITALTRHYDQWREGATVLDIREGSLVYWPSSAWHVGESPEGLSVSASVALYVGSDPLADVSALARGLVEPVAAETYPWSEGTPEELEDARRALATTAGSEGLSNALREAWLCHYTAGGFASPPPPEEAGAGAKHGRFRIADARFPVAVVAAGEDSCLIGANGHAWSCAFPAVATELAERLNRGETVTTGDGDGNGTPALLDRLVACRAVVQARPASS